MNQPTIRFNFQRRPIVEFDDCCLEKGQYITNIDQRLESIEVNGSAVRTYNKNTLRPEEFLCMLRDILNLLPGGKEHHFSSDHVYVTTIPAIFDLLGADIEVVYQDKTLTRQDVLNDYKQGRATLTETERLLDLLSQGQNISIEEEE